MVDVVLIQTGQVVTIFESITSYVKVQDKRALFGLLLKSSRFFIEQFTRHSIPFFTKIFKAHKNDIVAIFRTFQMATRMLQTICSHVKVIKDIQLASYVPPLKKAMEIVIYQVKILLSENNAPADVFFLGALKHRDLSGAPVSSQIPKDDDSEESQDELLSDTSPPTSKTPVSLPKARLTKGSKQSATRTRPSASTSSVLQGLPRTADEILDSDDDADECGSDTSDQIRLLLPTTRSLLPGRHLSPVLPQREPLDVDALAESDTDDDSNSNEDDPVSPVPGRKTTSMIISDSDTDDDDQPSPLTKTFDLTRRPSASNRSTSGYFPPKKSGHQSSNDAPVAPASRKRSYGMTGPKKRLRPM
ncbi:hypothetical protein DM01DRAFT_23463 [Hesseltinella vesiculosa]|uniref:Uncharacterized protein n=1 Tax=Hesseltinella vesiculosa TaxID=101127 RepID=A0A1X2GIG8_9FUNG|nr:hypothetical protein DM01DRAFT_23463 [Hesseltinella vesiculosa]